MDCYYLPHHLLPFLILLGFFLINGDFKNISCSSSFDCGNGINLRYPFWHQNQHFEHCGYPNFNLSCNDQNPIILFPIQDYYTIKAINYTTKSLTLAYPLLQKDANCPKLPTSLNLTTFFPLFNTTLGNQIVHFFYNCSLFPPSTPQIECLEFGTKRSFLFKEGSIPEFDWLRYCESSVVVPIIDKAVEDGDLVREFGRTLQNGFNLGWNQPDKACQSCEASGGFCSYSNGILSSFFCICSNGRQKIDCYENGSSSSLMDNDTVSISQKPNYVVLGGALIFGGLVIIATVFYLLQKKKVGSYKPV